VKAFYLRKAQYIEFMNIVPLLKPAVEKNAAIEQANRLTAVRAIARHLFESSNGRWEGSWAIRFVPKEEKGVLSPLVRDIARLRAKDGVMQYGVKSTESIAGKKLRTIDGGRFGKAGSCGIPYEAEKIRDMAAAYGSKEVLELLGLLEEKQKIAAKLFEFAASMRSQECSGEDVKRLLCNIDHLAEAAAPKESGIDHHAFTKKMFLFTEQPWPITREEAAKLVEKLDDRQSEKREKLTRFVEDYLAIERKNFLRGSLEYSPHERLKELIDAILLGAEIAQGNVGNAQQEAIEEGRLELGDKLNTLRGLIDGIEKKCRELREALSKDPHAGKFELMCEAARLRSGLLRHIKETCEEICKKKPGERYGYILHALSGIFDDFTKTSPEEAQLWEGFAKAFKKELSREQRKRVWKYIEHVRRIQAQPEAKPHEKRYKDELSMQKEQRSRMEKDLLETIKELRLLSPVEGEVLLRAYLEIKSHVRYKLGDWLYPAEMYLTPEKAAETILRMAHAMKKGDAKYSVFGKPLTEFEEYVRGLYKEVLERNKRIYALCGEIKIGGGKSIALILDEAANSVGYVPENVFDGMFELDEAERLLWRNARDEEVVFEYTERVEGGRRIIQMWKDGKGEPIQVELNPREFAHEFEKRKVKDVITGRPFDIVDAAIRIEESGRGAESPYAAVADFVFENMEWIFETEREVRNPKSDLYLVARSKQRELNGVITESGEVPPKFLGENELEKNLRERLGGEFDVLRKRAESYLEMERVVAMLDELHIRQKEIILNELGKLLLE